MKHRLPPRVARFTKCVVLLYALAFTGPVEALIFNNFSEFGTNVNGYQDDFNGTTLNPDWLVYNGGGSPNLFTLSGSGSLIMNPAAGDPNKLLYNPASGYDNSVQEVLALIRVNTDTAAVDGFRGGVASVSNTFDGQGINLLIRQPGQNGPGNHFNLLDDARAWGPNTDPNSGGDTWAVGQYLWLRISQDATGTNFGKIWAAGTTPEPANFDLTWSGRGRSGLAGLTTNSINGAGVFEVDYVLIKAAGLPSIKAVPEPSGALLVGLAGGIVGLRRRRV
jgi:hypothetical protein